MLAPKSDSQHASSFAGAGDSFDAMLRPTGLTDQNSNTIVNNVTYNAANQLLTFNAETRTYNNLNQMTRLTVTGNFDISYNFMM